MATWKMLSFQDAVSPIKEQLIMFHDHTMMIIMMITTTVLYMMISLTINKLSNRNLLEGQLIELVWTLMPAMLLVVIAMPSLKILYLIEEINKPLITMKAIGHQWYWTYEYSDFMKIEFESYMKKTEDLEMNEYRLIEVDNRIIMPFNTKTRILVSSTDVIHSWTIPALGIKIDGTPGRINQGSIMMMRPGVFYGQCSEICGANHSFMPIVLESVNMKTFNNWVKSFL
ncbi:cytochrome c oxidase subunit II (mitochondrion) [Macrosteles quadrilineatus]|uniref:Cytochrome c oxidase subunit 2 n=1 Tax=Macrosteles quadrilineatus TaxID=74068 RepID=A0A343CXA3_MACQU|nr:cytochrome c oxidase subunit II [Macrosteles quadrilineatus]ARQ26985.1 cytochrome c oxidase subunit II [Macrosteles quadrilineatus]